MGDFTCKTCGAQFNRNELLSDNDGIIICKSCGDLWRNPYKKLTDNEKTYFDRCDTGKAALQSYNFTLAEESFNQAMDVYADQNVPDSQIIDALWGLVRSYYGIVLVKDYNEGAITQIYCLSNPGQITPFDENEEVIRLKAALSNVENFDIKEQCKKNIQKAGEGINHCIEEEEKRIVEYDYFIACKISKKTDDNPNTEDTTKEAKVASQLYDELTQKGVKVFYSKKSMPESVEYDAQVLNAMLRSDKMILICGGDENSKKYLQTPWVKSEWQRWYYMKQNGVKEKESLIILNINSHKQKAGVKGDIINIHQTYMADYAEKDEQSNYIKDEQDNYVFPRLTQHFVELSKTSQEEEKRRKEAMMAELQKDLEERKQNPREQPASVHEQNDSTKTNPLYAQAQELYEIGDYSGAVALWKKSGAECVWKNTSGGLYVTDNSCVSQTLEIKSDSINNKTALVYINIPSNVIIIGEDAFSGCRFLVGIEMPSSVISIGRSAFYGCHSLENLIIPSSVKNIGEYAFQKCPSLVHIDIHNGLSQIGENAFAGASSLISISIPSSVTSIGASAFFNCCSLKSVKIPSSVKTIGSYAFSKCRSLIEINMPSDIDIGYCAFEGCSAKIQEEVASLNKHKQQCPKKPDETEKTEVPEQVVSSQIGPSQRTSNTHQEINPSFNDHEQITEKSDKEMASGTCGNNLTWTLDSTGKLTISGTGVMEEYGNYSHCPWYSYREAIKTVVIESGVTSIGDCAFKDCTSLTSITIPSSVKRIGESAFRDCCSLTSIDIPSSVKKIGDAAFMGCCSLKRFSIPSSVKIIADFLFDGCRSLEHVSVPSSVTTIGWCSFRGCSSLEHIEMPSGVVNIGEGAFVNCCSLKTINIPSSVSEITVEVFRGCSSLESIDIHNGVTYIGNNAFEGCTALKNITIPSSVTSIWYYAFKDCKSLESISVPANVTSIMDEVFSGCNSLKSIIISESVTSIGNYAFEDCTSLKSVTIPSSVTSIGHHAFNGCRSLTSITIPSSVTSIGNGAFCYCESLMSITIPSSVTSIGNYAFEDCTSLKSVTIPSSVTSIGYEAFAFCTSLKSVTIPSSVTSIGHHAFNGCRSLTSITIPSSVERIGWGTFSGCNNLTITFRGSRKEWEKLNCDFPNVRFSR